MSHSRTRAFAMRPGSMMWAACLAAVPFAHADESPPPGAHSFPYELAITGLDQPIRVRLILTANGKPWRQHFTEAQGRYLHAAFAHLDADRNGTLSAAEAKRAPLPSTWANLSNGDDVYVAFNYRVLDTNNDGGLSPAEFEQYALRFGEVAVRLSTVPSSRSGDDLFRALDVDRNRVLTAAEWSAIEKLRERDRDGNRVLTPDELQGPLSAVMPPEFVAAVPGKIAARKPVQFELRPATDAPAIAEVVVDYKDDANGPQRPQVSVQLSPAAAALGLKLEQPAGRDPVLAIADRRLVLLVPPAAVRVGAALRQQLQQEFAAVLERSEQQVTAATTMPPLLKSVFGIADRNDDGRLEPAELEAYLAGLLPLQAAVDAARLRLVQFGERSGLMPLVDLNFDGRLSRRELQDLPRKLAALAGAAGALNRDELPTTSVLTLQRGPFGEPSEPNAHQNAGPPWFIRADRNQDGDLDREEFLGAPEDFERLDANKDGWIDLGEAILGDTAAAAPNSEKIK